MDQKDENEIVNREPKMDDVGTRYEHLLDYKESLETCLEIINRTGRGSPKAVAKFVIALEVLSTTIDAFSGYKDTKTEYIMYKLLNSVPKTKDELRAIGGLPLE